MAQTELAKLLNLQMAQPEQKAEMSQNDMLAQAIIGLAPILAGAALGGAQGGAAGAQAGMTGLQTIQAGKKEKKAEEKEALEAKKQRMSEILALSKEERAEKAAKRAEERQIAELGLSKERLELERTKAAKEKEPSGPQFSAGIFARRLEQAEQVFDQLAESGYNRAERKIEGILPGELQSVARRANDQAERNFVNAVLRDESGAAISESEFKNAEQQYFPRPGDSDDVIKQKKANRMQALAGLRAEAGKALERIPLVNVPAIAKKEPMPLPTGLGLRDAEAAPVTDRQKRIMELRKQLGK
jgi:hypothetical protein